MIKKLMMSALFSAAVLTSSNAAVYNGLAIGLNAGFIKANHVGKTFGALGLQLDYEMSKMNSCFVGGGLNLNFYAGKGRGQNHHFNRQFKYDFTSDLDFRVGYNFCNQTIVYGLLGGRIQHVKSSGHHHNHHHNRNHFHHKGSNVMPIIGVGAKRKLTKCITGGLEYKYSFERRHHAPASNSVLARVSYYI